MPSAWFCALAAPALAMPLLFVAVRPRGETTAPLRLAAVRAALALGAFAVVLVEAAGALGRLTAATLAVGWLAFLICCAALAVRRRRQDGTRLRAEGRRLLGTARQRWRTAGRGARLLIATLGFLLLAELIVALLAEPNNYDSQTYHLPKVEHWAAQQNLAFWPTAIHRQVTIPPGAEYLLLHLRLLTGGDALHNLVQFAAGLGCLLMASRITAQLGGGRRAQLLTVFVLGTTPMVLLQATSTQTDLVAAAWTACVATLALDGMRRLSGPGTVLALGAATGLTAITKTSGLLGAGPMLALWGIGQLRLSLRGRRTGWLPGVLRTAAGSLGVLAVAAVLVGPFMLRVTADFGNPLGPPRLRESIPMQRHDPAAVLVNGLRIAHTALDTPLPPLRSGSAAAITGFAAAIGVDPQDRKITFGSTRFPVPAWYPDEDRVAFPIAGTLALVALLLALVRPDRLRTVRDGVVPAYAAATCAAVLLYPVMIKWQPWGNRLLLYALVLASPVVGLWLDAVLRRARPDPTGTTAGAGPTVSTAGGRPGGTGTTGGGRWRIAHTAVVVVLATAALAGVLAVSYGFPRRLVGTGSTLTTGDWQTRFIRRPQWAEEFRWAARSVTGAGARRIGLVQQNDNWEYPWWLLLRDRELVALQSVLPQRPPADPRAMDAIVCTGDRGVCRRLVPADWTLTWNGYVGYALPPGR